MGKLATLPGVEITINDVHGTPLPEHQDPSTPATWYVEARDGYRFNIHLATDPTVITTAGAGFEYLVRVDGQKTAVMNVDWKEGDDLWINEGIKAAGGKVRKYQFAELETIEGPAATGADKQKLQGLGTIVVKVYLLASIEDREEEEVSYAEGLTDLEHPERVSTISSIAEKDGKGDALSHSVKYGKAVKRKGSYKSVTKKLASTKPVAVFNFRYRSNEALKSLHIVPRTPEPEALEDRNAEDVDHDGVRELQRQLREAKAAAARIKQEDTDENPRPRKRARVIETIILDDD